MIGIVVPVHNERDTLAECLTALRAAANSPGLQGEQVEIVVVLDACTDDSAEIAAICGVRILPTAMRNVGNARALGAEWLLQAGARWLAFTDADSVVAPDWLDEQLGLRADAVCGCVQVHDWSDHTPAVRDKYLARYVDRDGHRHIHGANLGVSADAYRAVGGFQCLVSGEDVALVESLMAAGVKVAWSAAPRVRTSARRRARAPGGFSDYLRLLAEVPLGSGTLSTGSPVSP
jgi:glycosyltransferase involved in cell wall biosynthesis